MAISKWTHVGRYALNMKEYPILMGMIIFTAFFVILGNLIADVAIALIDPRVKLT